jgi:hypothetical protein
MDLKRRIEAFAKLSRYLEKADDYSFNGNNDGNEVTLRFNRLRDIANNLQQYNGWFDKENVFYALKSLGTSLKPEKLQKWAAGYTEKLNVVNSPKTVAVVMAGNVPAVGFHDFLTVLMSGNSILIKLSSDDDKLLPAISNLLIAIEPGFKPFISFSDGHLKNFDAIIATGSNNTSRYFEYYFGKYKNIIRKNRNGVALLTGKETTEELRELSKDIFLYYGLGCRNVSKLFVPQNYDFKPLLDVLSENRTITGNHKYFNNYEYNKAIFLVNKREHLDSGNLLLNEDENFASPVSVLHYEYYKDETQVRNRLTVNSGKIQCIVSNAGIVDKEVPLGKSQSPEPWDYADGVDTMDFLLSL